MARQLIDGSRNTLPAVQPLELPDCAPHRTICYPADRILTNFAVLLTGAGPVGEAGPVAEVEGRDASQIWLVARLLSMYTPGRVTADV